MAGDDSFARGEDTLDPDEWRADSHARVILATSLRQMGRAFVCEPLDRGVESHLGANNERRRLEGVPRLLAGHLRASELSQVGIDPREQGASRRRFAAAQSVEEQREIGPAQVLAGAGPLAERK